MYFISQQNCVQKDDSEIECFFVSCMDETFGISRSTFDWKKVPTSI